MLPLAASATTRGSVPSADGTTIGYLRVGDGPAVVLVHGSMEWAGSHSVLASALSDAFTVYLPDRRGRGMSGPFGPEHGMRTEVEDLTAVIAESGAERIFGVSTGGLIALETARAVPTVRKVAVYEPALLMDRTRYTQWIERFDAEMADGNVAAALITSMHGLDLAPPIFKLMPRKLAEALTNLTMQREDKTATSATPTMRQLASTVRYEGLLLAETAGTIESFGHLDADVLLVKGTKRGPAFLAPAYDAFAETLPHSRCIEIPGLDHGGSSDLSATNRAGKPELVAEVVRPFFAER